MIDQERKDLVVGISFPHYQDHKLHLGLASFYMDDETKQSTLDQHVTVLQHKGNVIETTPETPFP